MASRINIAQALGAAGAAASDGGASGAIIDLTGRDLAVPTGAGGVPFWDDSPDAWDQVVLAGIVLPGICVLTGDIEQKVDIKKPAGSIGGRTTILGFDLAKFTVTVTLWTPAHLADWKLLMRALKPLAQAGQPQPTSIYHPSLEMVSVRAVTIVKIGLLQMESPGFYTSKLEALEFRYDAGKPATPKTTGLNLPNAVTNQVNAATGVPGFLMPSNTAAVKTP